MQSLYIPSTNLTVSQTDFEEAIYAADSNAAIYTFDFTVNGLDPRVANRKEFTFYPWGLGGTTKHPIYTLADISEKLGHDHIDVLKIDIESAEMEAIPQLFSDPKQPTIDQVLIEVHHRWWDHFKGRKETPMRTGLTFYRTFDLAGYELVSSEWNTYSAALAENCCKELVFVHRDAGLLLVQ